MKSQPFGWIQSLMVICLISQPNIHYSNTGHRPHRIWMLLKSYFDRLQEMFTTQDFTTLWQHLEVPIFIGYTVSGDIIDKTAFIPGKYKAWIYQHDSSLASTCVRRAINISGIDGTIDQCTLKDGSRFSEASAALLSTSREQSCNY